MFVVSRNSIVRRSAKSLIRGVSLIEVLISVLLAAIGLLALSGANVASIRYSKLSQYRGTATMLMADLAERMRANPAGLIGSPSSYAITTSIATQTGTAPTGSTACEGYGTPCTAAQLAAYDLANWLVTVRNQLPEGSAYVVVTTTLGATNPNTADVWLAWRDPAVADPSENSTDARNYSKECSPSWTTGTDKSIRCSYFRISI